MLVGSHQQAGQCPLKGAAGLDGHQDLNGTDAGLALAKNAVSEVAARRPGDEQSSCVCARYWRPWLVSEWVGDEGDITADGLLQAPVDLF